jgi:biopolymer transport protein ExbD
MGALDAGAAPEAKGKKGPGLHKRKGRPGMIHDMTPMVDIGFLLLIFFMCTTRFREPQAIEITLPPNDTTRVDVKQSNVLTINIMAGDTILQYMASDVAQPVAVDSLHELLARAKLANIKKQPTHIDGKTGIQYESGELFLQRYNALPKDVPQEIRDSMERVRDEKICRLTVLIKVNRESVYDKVVSVMDAIQQNQVSRFSIIAQSAADLKEMDDNKKAAGKPAKGGK